MIQPVTMKPLTKRDIFFEALELPTPESRAAYLQAACGGDVVLRRKIDELLKEHFSDDSLLAGSALERERDSEARRPASEAPAQMIGRYKLLERIGEGGFGEVWMAEQREPVKRRVALKIIKLGMDSRQIVARFEAERQALAMMDHANIAKIFDAGVTDNGRPYFVMELVRGIKITEYCDQKQLPTRERLNLFSLVCHAIQHAHQKGIIHRDIKPSNILVTLHDGVPVPKVIDFGIAKATQGELTDKTVFTQFQQFIGTPAYISPEQAEMSGLDIDTRADIYSLGVLLYELLVGLTPFDGQELLRGGLDALRQIIREKEPLRPSTRLNTLQGDARTTAGKRRQTDVGKLMHQLRGDLDWIVMKCLEKDRTRRYETANGLAMDIQRHLANEPVVARPPSVTYQLAKFIRRHRAALAAAAAFVIVIILGAGISLQKAAEAQRRAIAESKARSYAQQQERIAGEMLVRAERQREENRQRLVRVNVATGVNLLEEGDFFAALPWFVEALRLEEGHPAEERNHRTRIGTVLKYSPRLVHNWFHDGPVTDAEFNNNGDHIVTASEDGTARVWEVATGRLLASLLHTGAVNHASFSPDGSRVLTASSHMAQVWDWARGQTVTPPITHSESVTAAKFSPDGRKVMTASRDHTAQIRELTTGTPLLIEHGEAVKDAAWSPDGRLVATISGDSKVKISDATSAQLLATCHGIGRYVYCVSFSADGQRVLWSSWGKAGVNDARTGIAITPLLKHGQAVRTAVFSPDERRILTASEDQTIQIWNSADGAALGVPIKLNHALRDAAFSPDGKRIITASDDGSARIFATATREMVFAPLKHSGRLTRSCFSPDGAFVLTAGIDGTVRLWDIATSGPESLVLTHKRFVRQISAAPDENTVATAGSDSMVRLWNADSGRLVGTAFRHDAEVTDIAFSRDGHRFATASLDGTARIWDVATGRQIQQITLTNLALSRILFSPDGEYVHIAAGPNVAFRYLTRRVTITDGSVRIQTWNVQNGAPATPILTLEGTRQFAEFSPDARRVAACSEDGTIGIWETARGTKVTGISPRSAMTCLRFSPDGRRLATANGDVTRLKGAGEAQVCDVETGKAVCPPLLHQADVCALAWSGDGRWILTASQEGTARIWDAETGKPRTPPLIHNYYVFDAVFSPDNRYALTGSGDQTARVWDAATGELMAPLFRHPGFVYHVAFTPDSSRVIAALEQSLIVSSRLETNVHIWQLVSDERPTEDLRRLAELLSGHRIDATSSLVPLESEAFRMAWTSISEKYPGDFKPKEKDKLAWHDREAKSAEEAHNWLLAARHLRQLLRHSPGDAVMRTRLTNAERAVASLLKQPTQTNSVASPP